MSMKTCPVVIPVLNRPDHLLRCLQSLSRNTLVSEAEIYISVDYPPSIVYEDGYKKVLKVLEEFDFSCFKGYKIFYQEHNIGAARNFDFLREQVEINYDRYIFSEDDNEFSRNFLEYMWKMLDLFEKREDILTVCGAKNDNWYYGENDNITLSKLSPAYGLGIWIEKNKQYRQRIRTYLLDKKTWKVRNAYKLFKNNKTLFALYILAIIGSNNNMFYNKDGELIVCDSVKSIYMHLTDTYNVVPLKPKSRTWGNDGSGVNMKAVDLDVSEKWPLDEDESFDVSYSEPLNFDARNYKVGDQYMSKMIDFRKNLPLAVIMYFLLVILGFNREKYLAVIKFLKSRKKRKSS